MSRQIKFRAWDGKEMHMPEHSDDSNFYISCDGVVRYIKEVGNEGHSIELPRIGWTLMQYTGLKDKNGTEIYEDDILRINDKQMQVVFHNGCFYTHTLTSNYRLGGWALEAVEIIGNIHQHPDLLPQPVTPDQWTKEYQGRTGDDLPEGTDTVPTTQGNG